MDGLLLLQMKLFGSFELHVIVEYSDVVIYKNCMSC
jgi:hypothetical protein